MNSDKYKPINKKTQHLRFMMSYLDNEIGDCSEEMKESIDMVWDAIDELEKAYED
tara:strand:+ start:457 stop:621 length:165 start_codon:yes stop_codon:yes gene_type:complete